MGVWLGRRGGYLVLGLMIVLGLGLRFVNLSGPVYWHDEAFTSLRLSGHTVPEVLATVFTGDAIAVEALRPFQSLTPGRGVAETVRSLAQEDVQHPPLYYVLAYGWARIWGEGIGAIRSLSAIAGGLALGAAYWFGRELFRDQPRSRAIALGGTALIALSPYHLLYAQEAREYALWTLTTLVVSAALLRSLHRPRWWLGYGLGLGLGLYTHPFTVLTLGGHGLYLAFGHRRQFRRWLAVGAIALGLYLPWLQLMIDSTARQGAGWTANPLPLPTLMQGWAMEISHGFLLTPQNLGLDHPLIYLTLPLFLGLLLLSSHRLIRETPPSTWLFLGILAGSATLPLMLPDLLLGGQRSVSERYLVPLYLALPWPIAYGMVTGLWRSRPGAMVGGLLIAVQVISCGVAVRAESSWIKVVSYNLPTVARIINQSPDPWVISTSHGINFGTVLALSHRLDPAVRLQLIPAAPVPDFLATPRLPETVQAAWSLNANDRFRFWLGRDNRAVATPVFEDGFLSLWRLQRSPP